MGKLWRDAPSPCIGICKFRDDGHCIGCTMTKPEKKRAKKLKGKAEKKPFFLMLRERLLRRDRYAYWSRMYRRRCAKKDVPCPLDRIEGLEELTRAA